MTKYIKLTSLLLFIAVALTGFGLYNAQASSPFPELNIMTSKGKPVYAESFYFSGFVSDSQNYSNVSNVEFKNGNSLYREDVALMKRLDLSFEPWINELITDHRSFMRGKSRRSEHFVETEDYIIYTAMENDVHWASSPQGLVTLAVLDKETEEEETFTINLNGEGNYYTIRATYVNYPSLTLLVQNYSSESQDLIYTVDLENPAEELAETVNLSKEIGSTGSTTQLNVGHSFDKTERFIPLKLVSEVALSEYDYTTETRGYYAYDIQNQAVIEVPMFEEDTLLFSDNNTLYAGKDLGETLELYDASPEKEEMDLVGIIEMATPTIGRDYSDSYNGVFNQRMALLNGQLYAYEDQHLEKATHPIFQVSDIHTQETLFQGSVEPRDSSKYESTRIELYEFHIDTSTN